MNLYNECKSIRLMKIADIAEGEEKECNTEGDVLV